MSTISDPATGAGAVRLSPEPEQPLLVRQLIFLHSNNDILAWLLANHGQDPLDLLVVKSGRNNTEDRAQMPEPAKRDTRFSIATFGNMLWGSCKWMRMGMRIRIRMRMRRRRND